MKNEFQDKEREIEIAQLYPTLTTYEQQEAEENLERYLELALQIYERLRSAPDSYQQLKLLTQPTDGSSMHGGKVDASQSKINPSQT